MNSERNNRLTMGIILAILFIGVVSVVVYQNAKYSDNFFEYNGFTIYESEKDGLNTFQIQFFKEESEQPFIINSRFNPEELESIPTYVGLRDDVIKQELYVTMDPGLSGKATIAFAEIDKYVENPFLFNLPTFPGLLNDVENTDLPVITCENVTESKGVIMFDIGDENRIYENKGCVVLEALNEDDLIKVADRLSLTVLGVLKE